MSLNSLKRKHDIYVEGNPRPPRQRSRSPLPLLHNSKNLYLGEKELDDYVRHLGESYDYDADRLWRSFYRHVYARGQFDTKKRNDSQAFKAFLKVGFETLVDEEFTLRGPCVKGAVPKGSC